MIKYRKNDNWDVLIFNVQTEDINEYGTKALIYKAFEKELNMNKFIVDIVDVKTDIYVNLYVFTIYYAYEEIEWKQTIASAVISMLEIEQLKLEIEKHSIERIYQKIYFLMRT